MGVTPEKVLLDLSLVGPLDTDLEGVPDGDVAGGLGREAVGLEDALVSML